MNTDDRNKILNSLDFECGPCEITWARFHQNNIPCTNSSLGEGVHDFDLKKPITTEYVKNMV
jgi:hypothetical protein